MFYKQKRFALKQFFFFFEIQKIYLEKAAQDKDTLIDSFQNI